LKDADARRSLGVLDLDKKNFIFSLLER